ncbi:MAG: monovalent cation/H+ antiporter subunit D family protein [Planctomycetales bacterium]|nr:monovalent cation/H+ antiporter subunit D family protein [Planctomycetales bacterium]
MSAETRILLLLVLPLLTSGLIVLFGRRPNLREAVHLSLGSVVFGIAASLAGPVFHGLRPELQLGELVPGFAISFRFEPLGMLFALVASGLWVVTTAYAMGYMRAHHEANQTRFFACFPIAICAALGAAGAANLLTLFLFYELMTLSTFPLVTHHGDEAAQQGGRTYLTYLLGSSIMFFLLAIAWTWQVSGRLDFVAGGILSSAFHEGRISRGGVTLLVGLYAYGVGKAALMPLHRWLPAAMVAPTPVSALLHAVAVVKVGVFTILKIMIYTFGASLLNETGASLWLMYVAGASVLLASWVAMHQDNLKARLAYSTVSQLAYITLGAALATPAAWVGAAMHIAMHAVGKITLFFCAGAIYVATHRTQVSQLRGLGRQMPWTMAAFLLGSLSIIGVPPCGGLWSKWMLATGAVEAHQYPLMAVLMISSLLNIAYLLPIPIAAFFAAPEDAADSHGHASHDSVHQDAQQHGEQHGGEAPLLCVVPPCLTAIGGLLLFFLADKVFHVLSNLPDVISN